jgi:chromosome segregation ATPase
MALRLHHRLRFVGSTLALLLALAGCQTMAGTGEGKAEFVEHRQKLSEDRAALDRAVAQGDLSTARTLLASIRARLDTIEKETSAMNMIDRQSTALQIATARRTMTEADRYIDSGDAESVRTQITLLNGILAEIDTLLDRTIKGSNPDAPSTG